MYLKNRYYYGSGRVGETNIMILWYNLDPPSILAGVAPLAPVPLLAQAVAQALGAHLLRGPRRVALARCG